MRYLNRIIFINIASIKYSEINLDGNVHFTGTQGVGKSTILRAILFFYNADQRKLGVPTGPTNKNFAEWYFPYINSYIIYEVQKETGFYSVLLSKSQNRMCFRFFDGAYHRKYFIDPHGNAFENWGKSRAILDADRIGYSEKISHYGEYRDIIYGNYEGKKAFKKYALLESKQYKNIPRTIQNVFLNSKLEANFIKETIIMSMNEEDIIIDLQKYTHHLKDFEIQLSDIEKFRKPSVRKHAEMAANLFVALQHLETEKVELARLLHQALGFVNQRKPLLSGELEREETKQRSLQEKIKKEQSLFHTRERRFLGQISVLSDKLKDAKTKREKYERINIYEIIKRISAKNDLEIEKQNLQTEQGILSSKFIGITQKYVDILKNLNNDFETYRINKDGEKLKLQVNFQIKKESVRIEYEQFIGEIKRNHKEELEGEQQALEEKQKQVFNLKNKKAEITHKRFYEEEIGRQCIQVDSLALEIAKGTNDIKHFREQIETIEKKWEFEKQTEEKDSERKEEKIEERIEKLQSKLQSTLQKIEDNKESFFEWLNINYPEWENTIGKMCDEQVLFQNDLYPELVAGPKDLFYGIKINEKESNKTTKTIADYKYESTSLTEKIKEVEKDRQKVNERLVGQISKIQKRNQPKIREYKDSIRKLQYETEHASTKKQQIEMEKNDFLEKGKIEKQQGLQNINERIGEAAEQELKAKEKCHKIKNQIERKIKTKERERDHIFGETQKQMDKEQNQINVEIISKREFYEGRKKEVDLRQKQELNNQGADTERLSLIEKLISGIDTELTYIEKNRDLVAEYNQDKREFFDRVKEFKNRKQVLDQEYTQEIQRYHKIERSLQSDLATLSNSITNIKSQLGQIEEDLKEFSRFKLSEIYPSIEPFMGQDNEIRETEQGCKIIIEQIMGVFFTISTRVGELKESIDKFLGNFSEQNIFKFKTNLISTDEYMNFSEELMDFIEEDKISEFETRVNERFADIISTIGKETTDLISKTGEVQKIVGKINADFIEKNFVGAIKKIELRVDETVHNVVVVLKLIKNFNDDNAFDIGTLNLFSTPNRDANNKKAIELLKQLLKEIDASKRDYVKLSDSFELKFRVKENENDTNWVEKLSNVGSDGTDVLVKAMVNIMLLNVFKEGASKRFKEFRLHCMMDEIGKLHPNNVKGILKFANERNILLINGSPIENTPLSYKHIYIIRKDSEGATKVNRYLSNFA